MEGSIIQIPRVEKERKMIKEKTAKQGSTIVSALTIFYKELPSVGIRGVQCSFEEWYLLSTN